MMPRNIEENVYITVGFRRHSATLSLLQREADDLDISVPHLIKLLLADRAAVLEGHGKDLWFPREKYSVQVPRAALPPVQQFAGEDDASRRAMAAAAAANYWED